MFENIINPKRSERSPWKMLPIGIIYGTLSLILVHWFFSNHPTLSDAAGILVVLFGVLFTLPYMYFIIKREEREDEEIEGFKAVWRHHKDALHAFIWLFLGFVIALSFWHLILENASLMNFQIQTYCQINNPQNLQNCVANYLPGSDNITGDSTTKFQFLLRIVENNIGVMIFTLIFSLIFGAGAIFILIWNASVIAAAIGIFTDYSAGELLTGLGRYMIHGIPEIAAYFIAALAGGMFGVGFLRHGWPHGLKDKKFIRVVQNSLLLLFLAIIVIILAGVMEVYLTPQFFG